MILSLTLAVLPSPAWQEPVERRLGAMGTELTVRVEAPTRAAALTASEAAYEAVRTVESRLSTWNDESELARLNAQPVDVPLSLSPELAADLERARALWERTGGAFDPTVGGLVEAWNLRGDGRIPSQEEIDAARVTGGMAQLVIEGTEATRRVPGLRLEEGGFGKGIALDAALRELRDAGIEDAYLDLGGQAAFLGSRTRDIALAAPDRRDLALVEVELVRGSLATTGNSERGIHVDGEAYSHVLDPRTGRPAPDFGSVSVWCEEATAADALSTGLFVLGPDAALEFAAQHDDVEVVVLEVTEDGYRARASAGLAGRVRVLDPTTQLHFGGDAQRVAAGAVIGAVTSSQQEQEAQQDSTEDRLARLEAENEELKRRIDLVAEEVETVSLGKLIAPPVGESQHGLGPAASKIYGVEQGLSIGGYGEFLYENFQGGKGTDTADFLRFVLYFGYRFDEKWLLNSELEFEHATTSSNSDGQSGSASVEFAYLDYLHAEELSFRGGIVLIPMGFLNELHEPTTFFSTERTVTENRIIPTTWRENGIGMFGDSGELSYRAYVVTAFEGKDFTASGLRGARQKGNRADAEDLAFVGRLDWENEHGFLVGGSYYQGDTGQDTGIDGETSVYEVHAQWRHRGWQARALAAMANVDDAEEFNALNGLMGSNSIGEELEGWYVELGYDLLSHFSPGSRQSLTPFVRYEEVDTQAEVPDGFSSDPANDNEILTFGFAYQPNDSIIFKIDYQDWDNGDDTAVDQLNFAFGFVF